MQWLRWWHNTVSDPKWINVARKANASVGQVVSVWAALLEHASQASPRGNLDGFHEEDTDAMYGYEPGTTFAIVQAMGLRGVLDPERNSIARWDERQPKREDQSAERVRNHRAMKRNVTHGNAPVTHGNAPDTDTDTEREKNREEPPASAGGAGGVAVETSPAPKARVQIPSDWAMNLEVQFARVFELYPPEWCEAAVREAAAASPFDPVGYTHKILKRYAAQGGPDAPPTLRIAGAQPVISPEEQARLEAEEDARLAARAEMIEAKLAAQARRKAGVA